MILFDAPRRLGLRPTSFHSKVDFIEIKVDFIEIKVDFIEKKSWKKWKQKLNKGEKVDFIEIKVDFIEIKVDFIEKKIGKMKNILFKHGPIRLRFRTCLRNW